MTVELATWPHVFQPAPTGAGLTLLALHGTGGDERDLLPLASSLAPGATVLAPRGRVLERGMPRFFRRLAEGVFDLVDLARRTDELAEFVAAAADRYGFDARRLVALGYSNGANIGAALLLAHPGLLAGAALLRPTLPFEPAAPPGLAGTRVLVASGRADPFAPAASAERLAAVLRAGGAEVEHHWSGAGHALEPEDLEAARRFLATWR